MSTRPNYRQEFMNYKEEKLWIDDTNSGFSITLYDIITNDTMHYQLSWTVIKCTRTHIHVKDELDTTYKILIKDIYEDIQNGAIKISIDSD